MNRSCRGKNRLNLAARGVILLGFAAFFLKTIFTGDVLLFVHPRTVPVIALASAVLIVIAGLTLGQLCRGTGERVPLSTFAIWLLPLVFAFALPARSLGADATGQMQVQLTEQAAAGTEESAPEAAASQRADFTLPSSESEQGAQAPNQSVQKETDGVLTMESGNFYALIVEICAHPDDYAGKRVEVTGFVFRDVDAIGADQFVPARMLMTCCAADVTPVGLLCRYEGAASLTDGAWVRVTGTVGEMEYGGSTIPCILAETVEAADAPKEAYVYPY